MEAWLELGIAKLLGWVALPQVGMPAVFLVSFISATLLPLGSEPAVFGWVKLHPELFWHTVGIATLGNTLGGMVDYWMGYAAKQTFAKDKQTRIFSWLERFGAKACLLSWLPAVGDPLCSVAGWLKLPFWSCVMYMAIGKFLRYVTMTVLLLYVPNSVWQTLWQSVSNVLKGIFAF